MRITARCGVAVAILCCVCSITAARPADAAQHVATLLDPPARVKSEPAKSPVDPVGEIRCTYFLDFMVVETGTDSPAPGPATILPPSTMGGPAPCRAPRPEEGMSLSTQHHTFIGRKGPFLLFEATDPNGAVPFDFIAVSTGRSIYRDAITGGGFRSIDLAGDKLHLRYVRGYNGSCSVLKGGQACWAKMAREGHLPPAVARLPPPVRACTVAYRKTRTPANDPNVISYEVDVTVDMSGKTRVNSVGPLGCAPLP